MLTRNVNTRNIDPAGMTSSGQPIVRNPGHKKGKIIKGGENSLQSRLDIKETTTRRKALEWPRENHGVEPLPKTRRPPTDRPLHTT